MTSRLISLIGLGGSFFGLLWIVAIWVANKPSKPSQPSDKKRAA